MIINYLKVFLVGGTICLIAQILMDYFKLQTPYVMVTYVTTGVILTFLGIYDKIVDFGAAFEDAAGIYQRTENYSYRLSTLH